MKRRVAARSEPVQHEMDVTQLDHRSTRFYFSLIVLAVSPVPTMPGIRSLNHPERFSSGVNPCVPVGRVFTSIRQPALCSAIQASRW